MPEGDGATAKTQARRPFRWRPALRALHRDIGYLAVGLTFVYAVSGIAVNHIADWDPSFANFAREIPLEEPLPKDDVAAAARAQALADISGAPSDVYRSDDGILEITFDDRTLHVDEKGRRILEEGREPRVFLRAANWLHLNRGKEAWTYFADGYAMMLLLLACSGMFMLPGRKGLFGRGAFFVGIGIAAPLIYLAQAGGP